MKTHYQLVREISLTVNISLTIIYDKGSYMRSH